jgi:signal transduction histidine kinase
MATPDAGAGAGVGPPWPAPLKLALLLAGAYAAVALGTLSWPRQPGLAATLWYANAIAVAVLLQRPPRDWPLLSVAVAIAVFGANRLAGDEASRALLFVGPNLIEVLLGAAALRAAGLAGADLQQPQRMLQLLLLGALLPALVSASIAAPLLAPAGDGSIASVWLPWFEGSAVGAVGLLPLVCQALRERPASLRRHAADWRLWLLAPLAVAVTLLAMARLPYPFVVLSLPLLLAAMLLPPVSVALVVFLVSLAGALAMASGVFSALPAMDPFEQGFVYIAFAAALVPAPLLAAAMADLRASHDRLLARERELARANQGLEQFVRLASHDLREPLNTITQFGRLVQEDHAEALPEPARRYLGLMSGGAQRMRELLDDVLHFARVQRGVIEDPRPVALDEVLHEVLAALAARVERSGARLEVQPLPSVRGQASMLQLLFQNLLSNAIKFVPPGQAPRVYISAEVGSGMARVTVADRGIGIAEADRPKLFQPFQRLHLRREYEGTGLGLALARQIAQAHGGDIEVQSAPGQGSRFTVSLPLVETASSLLN